MDCLTLDWIWIVANAGHEAAYLNTGKGWCVNYGSASTRSPWRSTYANAHVPNYTQPGLYPSPNSVFDPEKQERCKD
jgi:hypothetical protein